MRVRIRAVVFDIGGVLEVTPRTGWQDGWALRLGLARPELAARLEPVWAAGAIGEWDQERVEVEIATSLELGAADVRRLLEDAWTEYLGTLNDDLARYFCELRPRYRTGILSNSFVGARQRERDRYRFEDMCDVIVYSHEEAVAKPDPRSYRRACQRLGVEPVEVLFLDDTDACVSGARAVGMTAVKFVGNAQAMAELDAHLGQPVR